MPMLSEVFPEQALDPVPTDRIADFSTHCQTQFGNAAAGRHFQQNKMGCMNSTPHFLHESEFPRLPQPERGRKRIFFTGLQVLLLRHGGAQRLATAGTPTIDNVTTVFGLHPLTETVGPLTLDPAGLKCALGHL